MNPMFEDYARRLDPMRSEQENQRILAEASRDERISLDEFRMLVDLACPFPGA